MRPYRGQVFSDCIEIFSIIVCPLGDPSCYCKTKNYTALKNFTLLALTTLFLIAFNVTFAQKAKKALAKCGTDEMIEQRMQTDPTFRAFMEKQQADYLKSANTMLRGNQGARLNTLTGPVIIPVVVHVVLPNPELISDAAVEYFLNRLN